MRFVDGENLTIRAQVMFKENSVRFWEGDEYRRDCFIWPATAADRWYWTTAPPRIEPLPVRSCYYTSLVGDDCTLLAVRLQLRKLGFEPHVFKKPSREAKSKGVDIELTKDMLSHAFRGNYDVAILIAGDGDYVPLVEEVKRLGKNVFVYFPEQWTSRELMLAADGFFDIGAGLLRYAKDKVTQQSADAASSS